MTFTRVVILQSRFSGLHTHGRSDLCSVTPSQRRWHFEPAYSSYHWDTESRGGMRTGSLDAVEYTSNSDGPPLAGVQGLTSPPYNSATLARISLDGDVKRNLSSFAGRVPGLPSRRTLPVGTTCPMRISPS